MKRFIHSFILLTFLLAACSTGATSNQTETTQQASSDTNAPSGTSSQSVTSREAVLSDLENTVSARATANHELSPATKGMSILVGGGVETGPDGKARLDLLPEGTIVRIGPNSSFVMPELADKNGAPKTTIQLLFGKIYILLNGGTLQVQTPGGVASVRGSLLSVEYDPETKKVKAACLEGHCALEDENGEEVELVEGEESYIEEGQPPVEPESIDSEEIQAWLDDNPELGDFMEDLPNPEDYPEPNQEEEMQSATEEATAAPEGESTEVPGADSGSDASGDDSSGGDGSGG